MYKSGMYLRGDETHPFHLSIGQVIHRDGQIAIIRKPDGVATLPRETTYLEETYLECLQRGAQEEVGAMVEPVMYLGTLVTNFNRTPEIVVHKTTLYFLTTYTKETTKTLESDELSDVITWESFDIAITLLKTAGEQEEKIAEIAKQIIIGVN